jgi:hemolysin-activating ACP:hemolysin acyltransferase
MRGPVMTDAEPNSQQLGEQFLKSLDKSHLASATSKLLAASIGDMVVVLSRSPAHKHYSLADIEWMVLPPVVAGQFYVAEATHKEYGFRVPIAVVTWALVSEEIDQQLRQQTGPLRRLRPDQWNSGPIGWLIDVTGSPEGVRAALHWLAAGPFKDRPLKVAARGAGSATSVTNLKALLAEQARTGSVA